MPALCKKPARTYGAVDQGGEVDAPKPDPRLQEPLSHLLREAMSAGIGTNEAHGALDDPASGKAALLTLLDKRKAWVEATEAERSLFRTDGKKCCCCRCKASISVTLACCVLCYAVLLPTLILAVSFRAVRLMEVSNDEAMPAEAIGRGAKELDQFDWLRTGLATMAGFAALLAYAVLCCLLESKCQLFTGHVIVQFWDNGAPMPHCPNTVRSHT